MQVNKRDLLKQGGITIYPVLADGKKVEVIVDFSLGSKRLVDVALQEMEEAGMHIDKPNLRGLLVRSGTVGLSNSPHDMIAVLRGMTKGTEDEICLYDCQWATLTALEMQQVQYALAMSMLKKANLTQDDWDSIQDANDEDEAKANFLMILGRLPQE